MLRAWVPCVKTSDNTLTYPAVRVSAENIPEPMLVGLRVTDVEPILSPSSFPEVMSRISCNPEIHVSLLGLFAPNYCGAYTRPPGPSNTHCLGQFRHLTPGEVERSSVPFSSASTE